MASEEDTTTGGVTTVTNITSTAAALERHHHPSIAGYGLWFSFTILVAGALTLDLVWGQRRAAQVNHMRTAMITSVAWLSLGLAFAAFLSATHGGATGFIFLTGYLLEKSLSVDNLIVIALVFKSFRIKPVFQGPVLKWGILGAVIFRTIFIFAGVALLEFFSCTIYIFGVILLWSAYKMYVEEDDDNDDIEDHAKGNSWMMRCLTLFIPYNSEVRGNRFVEMINGRWHATPMLAALVVVELSDVLFAVDSIPCILGVTEDLFLVFSSNMLAILGLRSLYLLLAEALDKVQGLKKGLALILAFVGVKMLFKESFPLPQWMQLLVIISILGATVIHGTFRSHTVKMKLDMDLPI